MDATFLNKDKKSVLVRDSYIGGRRNFIVTFNRNNVMFHSRNEAENMLKLKKYLDSVGVSEEDISSIN